MDRTRQTGVLFFMILCLVLLVAIISLIFLVNRPRSTTRSELVTPTPVARPTLTQVERSEIPQGETNFTDEDVAVFLEERSRAEQAYQTRKQRMPFITKLPYANNHFKIEITALSDTIYITTYGDNQNKTNYRNEALQWLTTNGGNPNNLTIQYKN